MRAVLELGLVLVLAAPIAAQTGIRVELDEVTDNRMSIDPNVEFQMRGSLDVRVKLTGNGLDKAAAARVIVKEAKDDKGNALNVATGPAPDFTPRDYNNGTLNLSVQQPARTANTVSIKGTVELYVPARDPAANIKIDKALAKLDKPLSSKALTAAKLELTPLSRDGYTKLMQARKITDADIEKLRAEAKKNGASEADIELAIGLAKAFEGIDADTLPAHAVIFSGKKSDFDRIYRIELLGGDGNPLHITTRSTSSRGESSLMTLQPNEAAPENAALQLMLVTEKSRVSFPFELKVSLP